MTKKAHYFNLLSVNRSGSEVGDIMPSRVQHSSQVLSGMYKEVEKYMLKL